MLVRSISIRRVGDYGSYHAIDASKPFQCSIATEDNNAKVELIVSPELSAKIVALIAEEVATAGKKTAEAMVADMMAVTIPAVSKAKAKELQ